METVATYGWRKNPSVKEALFAEGERFSFYQAVRLLERLFPDRAPVAEGIDPRREVVRFKSSLTLGFAGTEVQGLAAPSGGGCAEMKVNFMGLAGAQGPLPRAFTELVLARAFRGDTAARDFLDIFNHRLVSLLYRSRKKHRPALDCRSPEEGRVASCLFALTGLGTRGLRGRMEVRDRALLPYAGLLTGPRRPVSGLERIVGGYFGVGAEVEPFVGIWHQLGEGQVTRIGITGQNQTLGEAAVVGRRVWDQQAGFELRLGPLTHAQLLDFLPTGRGFRALCALVSFYVGEDLDFHFRLVVAAAEVPATRLGRAGDARLGWSSRLESGGPSEARLGSSGGSRLGWTSWLRTRDPEVDDEQLRLTRLPPSGGPPLEGDQYTPRGGRHG